MWIILNDSHHSPKGRGKEPTGERPIPADHYGGAPVSHGNLVLLDAVKQADPGQASFNRRAHGSVHNPVALLFQALALAFRQAEVRFTMRLNERNESQNPQAKMHFGLKTRLFWIVGNLRISNQLRSTRQKHQKHQIFQLLPISELIGSHRDVRPECSNGSLSKFGF